MVTTKGKCIQAELKAREFYNKKSLYKRPSSAKLKYLLSGVKIK